MSLVNPHVKIQIEINSQQDVADLRVAAACESSRKNTNWNQFTTEKAYLIGWAFLWILT